MIRPVRCRSLSVFAGILLLAASEGVYVNKAHGQERSPFFAVPLVSSNPKLDTSVGVMVGYLKQFDEESTPSLFGVSGTYSASDSHVLIAFGQAFFEQGRQRFNFAVSEGKANNNYDDFLDSGMPAQTSDNFDALAARYLLSPSPNWYFGAQALSSNYVIEAEGLLDQMLEDIGLTGLQSVGLGFVAEYDSRDNTRNPSRGKYFNVQNYSYREALGGNANFDAVRTDWAGYLPLSARYTLAVQAMGRWTQGAPVTGYSSISLRGYVRGMYLAPNYTHVAVDNRLKLKGNLSVTAYAGLACLYEKVSECSKSTDLFPAIGLGLSYLLRAQAGIILRADITQGKGDNQAFYLTLKNPF